MWPAWNVIFTHMQDCFYSTFEFPVTLATCKEKKHLRNIIQEIFYVLCMTNKQEIYDILVHKSPFLAQISCFLHFKNFHVKIA